MHYIYTYVFLSVVHYGIHCHLYQQVSLHWDAFRDFQNGFIYLFIFLNRDCLSKSTHWQIHPFTLNVYCTATQHNEWHLCRVHKLNSLYEKGKVPPLALCCTPTPYDHMQKKKKGISENQLTLSLLWHGGVHCFCTHSS